MPVSNNDLLKEIRAMGTQFNAVTERLDNLDHKLDNNISDVNKEFIQILEQLSVVKNTTNDELAKLTERINALEINNNKLEKIMDLIVKGIPYVDGENLQSIISKISGVISFDEDKSITNIHRLKSTPRSNLLVGTNVNIMPVIVKFASQHSRRLFHMKYFAFNKSDSLKLSHIGLGSDNRIFINENLCKNNLDLLKRAKKLKKDGKIAAAYSYDGQICVYHRKSDKKFDIVFNVEDLKKFE